MNLTERERIMLYLLACERSVDRSGAAWEEILLRSTNEGEWHNIARKLNPGPLPIRLPS